MKGFLLAVVLLGALLLPADQASAHPRRGWSGGAYYGRYYAYPRSYSYYGRGSYRPYSYRPYYYNNYYYNAYRPYSYGGWPRSYYYAPRSYYYGPSYYGRSYYGPSYYGPGFSFGFSW